jgi:flagellar hook assembly protein FlgD
MKLYSILITLFVLTAVIAIFLFVTDLKAIDNGDSSVKIIPNYRTDGSVSFQILTVTNHGQFSTRNIGAIWISTESGTFVKTLKRWGNSYLQYLTKWHACTSSGNTTGATTGATLSNHMTHSVTWNCKNTSGVEVPDGNYKIWIEFTEGNTSGPWTSFTFTKGTSAQSQSPANQTYFHNIVLNFTPAAVIGAPVDLQASLTGINTVNLTWSAPASITGLTAYKVYRNGSLISTITNLTTTTYTDTPSIGNQTYAVTAIFGTSESTQSNVATVNIVPIIEAPSNLQVVTIEANNVTLSWSAPVSTFGLTGFKVYRDGVMVTTVTPATTSFMDTASIGDHSYYVTAVFGTTDSDPSNSITVSITANQDNTGIAGVTALNGNYPNPFNPETNIRFTLAKNQHAKLSIYNFKGQKVRELVSGNLTAGDHAISWNGTDDSENKVASGLYYYRLETNNQILIKKMIMLK